MIIGITGGSGCGKTTALDVLKELGFVCIDADAVYHTLLREDSAMLAEIDRTFPGCVENGILDRKKLGSIVFGDSEKLLKLNAITHPCVKRKIAAMLGSGNAAIDAFGLVEGELNSLCDHTVAILAPREARIERLMKREGVSRSYAEQRIDAQKSDAAFSTSCEYTLWNDSSREAFHSRCTAFFSALLNGEKKAVSERV